MLTGLTADQLLIHILLNRALGNRNGELKQLAMDALCALQGVPCCPALDQRVRRRRSPLMPSVSLAHPLPEQPKSLAMPAQNDCWLDDH